MSAHAAEIVAKGSSFLGVLKALEALRGTEARERVLGALQGEISEPLRYGQVLAMGWYPVTWYAELHAAIDRCLGEGPALARKLSHHATLADINSIYRFVAAML